MKIILFIILGYIVPLVYNYNWTRKAYSKHGVCEDEEINSIDVILTFLPLYNFIAFFIALFSNPYRESYKPRKNILNNIFNIKK